MPEKSPVLAAAADRYDFVFLRGFRAQTLIGIDADEQHQPQPIELNILLGRRKIDACKSDNIAQTIDYSAVRSAILAWLQEHRYQLLEALAEALAAMLLEQFDSHWVQIELSKPAKFSDVDNVGVLIERRRSV